MKGQMIWGVLGILCVLYGLFVRRAGSGTHFFVVWIALGAVFWCCSAACRVHLWQRMPGVLRGGVMAVLVALLALFLFVEAHVLRGFHQTGAADLDVIIVLGAQVRENGPSVVLRYRLDTAAAYLQENPRTLCIVSGGQGSNEPVPEAEVMAAYLEERGISQERILQESESLNTSQNIQNSMHMIYEQPHFSDQVVARDENARPDSSGEDDNHKRVRIGIVTNNFHIFRGCGIAKKAGLTDVCGIAAPSNRLYLPNNLLREFFGVVKDVMAGNL